MPRAHRSRPHLLRGRQIGRDMGWQARPVAHGWELHRRALHLLLPTQAKRRTGPPVQRLEETGFDRLVGGKGAFACCGEDCIGLFQRTEDILLVKPLDYRYHPFSRLRAGQRLPVAHSSDNCPVLVYAHSQLALAQASLSD